MGLSLKTKIRCLAIFPIVSLGLIVVLCFWLLDRREISKRIESDSFTARDVLKNYVEDKSDQLKVLTNVIQSDDKIPQDLGLLSRSDSKDPSIHSQIVATLKQQLADYQQMLNVDGLAVTDYNGQLVAEAGRREGFRTDRSKQPGVAHAKLGQAWRGIIKSPRGLLLAASYPLYPKGNHDDPFGAVTIYTLFDSTVAAKIGKLLKVHVMFLDANMVVGSSLEGTTPPINPARGQPTYVELNDTEYVGFYAPLPLTEPDQNLGFISLRDTSEITGTYTNFFVTFVLVLLPALVVGVIVAARMSNNMIRPLEGVVNAAIELEEGRWPEKFEIKRKDEIGTLQSAFNEMTSSLQASRQRLINMIDTDPLTELANHRRFREQLTQEVARSEISQEPLSIALLDLDKFAEFNEEHGLATGDQVLQRVARMLDEMSPELATVARYGGEEFGLLLPRFTLAESMEIAENIRREVQDIIGDEFGFEVTLSAGCAEFRSMASKPEGFLLASELALSRAKQLGRNRTCAFDSSLGTDQGKDPLQLDQFLQDSTLATIQALAAAVDAKDAYTQGHSQRVAEYAAELARYIGASKDEVDLVYRTGTLHDVGKIGVPDGVLNKTGPLSPEERAAMETHPVLGELIVKKVPQLQETLPGVRHHHERWDGKGYPDGLKGESIPRLARILAVADTFDAMTSDRPYRKGLAVEIALAEIAKGAASQFDPAISEAFVRMFHELDQQVA